MSRRIAALATALAALAAAPTTAVAGRPGVWTAMTAADGANTDQIGLVRDADGRLHVVWTRGTPEHAFNRDLMQTVVATDGSAGAAQTIASDWIGIGNPAIARDRDGGLLVVAGATQSLEPGAIQEFAAWRSSDGGATWQVQPGEAASGGGFSDDPGLAFGADGVTPFLAWGTTSGLFVHRGTDAATPSANLQQAAGFGCCGYDPSLARDGVGRQLVAAWYSNAAAHEGVFAQQIDEVTGGPVGAPALMPGSTTRHAGRTESSASLAHTPLVAREGRAGVFLAYAGGYPRTTDVVVWRVGARASRVIATRAGGLGEVGISATPSGRLWVLWAAGDRIYASRSNASLTRWGGVTSVEIRAASDGVAKLTGSAQDGVLDVLAALEPRGEGGVQTWHTQLRAGLTLAAAPSRLARGGARARRVTLKVTDAGAAVAGVTVRLAGASARTNVRGAATLTVGPFARRRALVARATKAGWAEASLRVRVR